MCGGLLVWCCGLKEAPCTPSHIDRRAEGGRVLGGMMLRRRRMRECKRELMCRRRAQNDAPEGCACGTASNFDRADGSGCGASGASMEAAAARRTAAATGWESRWSRPRDRLDCHEDEGRTRSKGAQGCAFSETSVCVVKGTASPDVTVRKLTSTFLRAVKIPPFRNCRGLAAEPRAQNSFLALPSALDSFKMENENGPAFFVTYFCAEEVRMAPPGISSPGEGVGSTLPPRSTSIYIGASLN